MNKSRRRPQEAQSKATFDFGSGSSGCPTAGQVLTSQGHPTAPARSRTTGAAPDPASGMSLGMGRAKARPGCQPMGGGDQASRGEPVSDTAPRWWGRAVRKGLWPAGSEPTVLHSSVVLVTCVGPGPKWLMRAVAGPVTAFPWLCLAVCPVLSARVRCSGPQQGCCSACPCSTTIKEAPQPWGHPLSAPICHWLILSVHSSQMLSFKKRSSGCKILPSCKYITCLGRCY